MYIKLADAAVRHRSAPYQKGEYRNKDLANPNDWGTTLSSGTWFYAGANLHRIHFHHQSLKADQLEVIDARASENGTRRKMKASIQGGPLSLFARDRVKFQKSFLGDKRLRDFNYLVDEVQDENGKWCYALHFRTTTTKQELDKLGIKKNSNKQWKKANKHKLLEGTILIDQDDYGILAFDCHVPNELKPFFCGYTTMAIKHFDYKLNARYAKVDGQYVLDYLRHEDEFIFKDTTDQTTTPYAAISEFTRLEAVTPAPNLIPSANHFANSNSNELYEYPLAYDSAFWVNYLERYPEVAIGADIRADMETDKPLEQQFRDKQRRDESLPPPVAPVEPITTTLHGETLTDDYAWLKDTKNPRANRPVMDYLHAENDYTENYYRPIRKLQREVFNRLKWDVEKDYQSLPTKDNGYYYFYTYAEDQEYPVYFRAPVADSTQRDTLFDVNKAAADYDTYSLGGISVAPNNQLMAYAENTTGSDRYVLRFRSLDGSANPADSLLGVSGLVWIDSETLLYSRQEPKTLRTNLILRHQIGTPQEDDEVIFQEDDPLYSLNVGKARSKAFIYVSSSSSDANEIHYLRTDQPKGEFRLVAAREAGVTYTLSHHKDKFYVLATDKRAINGQVFVTDTNKVAPKHWRKLIPHREEVMLEGLLVFDDYLVVGERENVQSRLRVINQTTQESHYVEIKEDIHSIGFGYNPEPNTDTLQFVYSSFSIPAKTINYHLGTKESRLVRQRKIKVRFGKPITKRTWATAPDGTQIPITLIYDKWRNGGKNTDHGRVFLTSYGAYGSGTGPGYSSMVKELITRGFTYAIAHVRGGNDMGMQWYHDGKLLNKRNTFTDFIACAEHLIEEGYAKPGSITAQGGSAGGLLMGAVANMRPELFRAIILDVPFVDVINTMLDANLPLTTGEYLEWGNPNKKKYFQYIKSYSPYENVVAQNYPHLFFFTGLNDTRVGYWEPAKMVAKLRKLKTDDNILLLKTDLNAGHGGASGRYASMRETAYKLALLFDLYAVEEKEFLDR
ncbi:MAG: S9 family peptidase [Bacteroidota bacterium]